MPEPIICPITQEPVVPGNEFTSLFGHTFDARNLAIWAAELKYRPNVFLGNNFTIDTASVSLETLSVAWIHGVERNQCLGRLFYDERLKQKLDDVCMFWMQETPENPLTRQPLTLIEKRALSNKITLLNHHLYLPSDQFDFSCTPAPEQFSQWSLDEQYDYLDNLGYSVEHWQQGRQAVYWAQAQLSAYAIAILANQIVAIPNKMDKAVNSTGKYASRRPENGYSVFWQLTKRLLTCLAFDERNLAVMNLLKALPKEQQLSYIDCVKELLTARSLSPSQLNRFINTETGRALYQTKNAGLMNEMVAFSLANHTQDAISGDHGRFARSGFEAPLVSVHTTTAEVTQASTTCQPLKSPSRVGLTTFGSYNGVADSNLPLILNDTDENERVASIGSVSLD